MILKDKGEGPPSYGSGRCGSGAFRAQDSILRNGCSVGRRHAHFGQISKYVGSVFGADRAV